MSYRNLLSFKGNNTLHQITCLSPLSAFISMKGNKNEKCTQAIPKPPLQVIKWRVFCLSPSPCGLTACLGIRQSWLCSSSASSPDWCSEPPSGNNWPPCSPLPAIQAALKAPPQTYTDMAEPGALPPCLTYHPLRLAAHSFSFHRLLGLSNDDMCHWEREVSGDRVEGEEWKWIQIK